MKSQTTDQSGKSTTQRKPAAKPAAAAKQPGGERPSLPEERAESEGMIAPPPEQPSKTAKVEGEGSYTATHNYDEGVARSVAAGNTEKLAKKAAEALDGPEGAELRAAEQAAKQGHAK